MNIRDDDQVSAVALVVESEAATAATVLGDQAVVPVDPDAPDLIDAPDAPAADEPADAPDEPDESE